MVRCGELVQPLINLMRERLLDHDFVQCDETPFQVLNEPGKSAQSQSYLWVQRGTPDDHPLILYEYDPSRLGEVSERLFEGFQGIAQTDGYAGYGHLDDALGIVHVGCWAHVRRKFMDALKGAGKNRKKAATPGKKQSVAEAGLRFLQDLYLIERSVAAIWKFNQKDSTFSLYPKPQATADTPKIQITREGAVWYSPRGSKSLRGSTTVFRWS